MTTVTSQPRVQVQVRPEFLPQRNPADLVIAAWTGVGEARQTRAAGLRYATAHLAALRAASAVVAARAVGTRDAKRRTPMNLWGLLIAVAPEMKPWAVHFAAGATKRAAAEAGIPRVVTVDEANACIVQAEAFIEAVEATLGLTRPKEA